MRLSKSSYTQGIQCPKMLWMDCHMSEMRDESVMNQDVLDTGNEVGDLAMGYFGDYVEVPYDPADFDGMIRRTEELIANGVPNVCEATFAYDGNLCMVDILRVEADGVHIVEVKSSTHINDIYFHDMAYQTWVLDKCGMAVKSISLMHLNSRYVRKGELDLHELFVVEDCTAQVAEMIADVERTALALKKVAAQDDEPKIAIGRQCKSPYECGYLAWCWRHLPNPNVFDLCRIRMDKALKLISQGVVSLKDATGKGMVTNQRQKAQVACEVQDVEFKIDAPKVKEFLDTLTFPLYFLDFETMQPAIPPFDGTWPYQQIPTQYSLHVLRAPNAELEHYEFLAEAKGDPRRSVAEHLVASIPLNACTLAYNMGFEKGRIRELADAFPDLAPHLLNIAENMHDLMVPFSKGWYYVRAMGGSNSIKAVLPALFPDDPELDYHALEGVHNGGEAMRAFEDLYGMDPGEAAIVREQLLRYCELDTLAMVRVWEKLREAIATPQ
ncbi:MAG: DUF2779 domain-containing protein [Atopobiaceae bacterium]|nr:DUF2779 domain-containing protein [Atopobiaceae bacterium]